MGKRIIQQRRGRGTFTYKNFDHKSAGQAKYRSVCQPMEAQIVDLIDSPSHNAPLAKIKYEDGQESLIVAPEEVKVGQNIKIGKEAENGHVLPLKNIPEGTHIFNIENKPGDGGKFVRSSGTFARIVAKNPESITVRLPSKKEKQFQPDCRATVGVVAGAGRKEKPFLKAGTKHHAQKAKNKLYPRTSAVAMNAVDHPFGGTKSSKKSGGPTLSSRHSPPGRKVGKIAPKRTGRRKR